MIERRVVVDLRLRTAPCRACRAAAKKGLYERANEVARRVIE